MRCHASEAMPAGAWPSPDLATSSLHRNAGLASLSPVTYYCYVVVVERALAPLHANYYYYYYQHRHDDKTPTALSTGVMRYPLPGAPISSGGDQWHANWLFKWLIDWLIEDLQNSTQATQTSRPRNATGRKLGQRKALFALFWPASAEIMHCRRRLPLICYDTTSNSLDYGFVVFLSSNNLPVRLYPLH